MKYDQPSLPGRLFDVVAQPLVLKVESDCGNVADDTDALRLWIRLRLAIRSQRIKQIISWKIKEVLCDLIIDIGNSLLGFSNNLIF